MLDTRPVVHTHHYAVFEVGASPLAIARTTWQEHWLNPDPKTLKPYPSTRDFVPLAGRTADIYSILAQLCLVYKGKEAWALNSPGGAGLGRSATEFIHYR